MALTSFADLRTELSRRGFDYLDSTRLGQFINDGYTEVCEAEDWPFLEATTSGAAPLTISDLRTIEYVLDTTNQYKLRPLDRRTLTDYTTDLTVTGAPEFYYLTSGSTVNVYPANTTSTLSVRYYKVPTALSADGDTPLVPERFRSLIVDAAVVRAYEDDDETNNAQAASQSFVNRLELMKSSLFDQQHDEPSLFMVNREWASWGGA